MIVALLIFPKLLELYKSLNDDKNRAATLLNHSIACKKQGYYQLALESAYEAAAFMEKQGEKTKLHFCYNTIATILEKKQPSTKLPWSTTARH